MQVSLFLVWFSQGENTVAREHYKILCYIITPPNSILTEYISFMTVSLNIVAAKMCIIQVACLWYPRTYGCRNEAEVASSFFLSSSVCRLQNKIMEIFPALENIVRLRMAPTIKCHFYNTSRCAQGMSFNTLKKPFRKTLRFNLHLSVILNFCAHIYFVRQI